MCKTNFSLPQREGHPETASVSWLRRRGIDVIDLAVEFYGDGLGLAQVLVVFGLLCAGELEVGVGQLCDAVALASSSGCDRRVDPALVLPVEGLAADLADLALDRLKFIWCRGSAQGRSARTRDWPACTGPSFPPIRPCRLCVRSVAPKAPSALRPPERAGDRRVKRHTALPDHHVIGARVATERHSAPRHRCSLCIHISLLKPTLIDAALPVDLVEATRPAGAIGVLRPRVQLHALVGQERRVGCQDAIFRAQGHKLVDQLFVLAVEVDLVDQCRRAGARPRAARRSRSSTRLIGPASSAGNSSARRSPPTLPLTRIVVLPDCR